MENKKETAEYRLFEIERAEKEHDEDIFISIKFYGSVHNSKVLNISKEELKKIKQILIDNLKK